MSGLRIVVAVVAVFIGGWLVFDGSRAFVVGDYVTPRNGPNAGQLGAWSRVVSALGLEPRSALVKSVHIAVGVVWLGALVTFFIHPASGRWVLPAAAVCTLWHLPVGTVLSLVEIVLPAFLKIQP